MIAEQGVSPAPASPEHFVVRNQCPVCSSLSSQVLVDLPYESGAIHEHLRHYYAAKGAFEPEWLVRARYRLLECQECGLIYQHQIPSAEFLARLYGHWIDPEAAAERDETARGGKVAQYLSELWLLRFWSAGRQLRILDYGMGHGRWLEAAYVFGHQVYGYEFEKVRCEHAGGRIHVLSRAEISAERFDYIHTEQVFEHLAEPRETLRELVTALKPGGLLRLSVPNGQSMRARVERVLKSGNAPTFTKRQPNGWNACEPLQHLNCYRPRTLDRLAATCGLTRYRFPLAEVIAARQDWRGPRALVRNVLQPLSARLRHDDGASRYYVNPGNPRGL